MPDLPSAPIWTPRRCACFSSGTFETGLDSGRGAPGWSLEVAADSARFPILCGALSIVRAAVAKVWQDQHGGGPFPRP